MGEEGGGGKREVLRPSSPQFPAVLFSFSLFLNFVDQIISEPGTGWAFLYFFAFAYGFELSFRYLIQFCVQLISAEIV